MEKKEVLNMAKNKTQPKKNCVKCKKSLPENKFYKCDNSPLYPDGRFHICSSCLGELMENEENGYEIALMALHAMNKPMIAETWNNSPNARDYFRQINSLSQYRGLTWENSDDRILESSSSKGEDILDNSYKNTRKDELIVKWGSKYDDIDLAQLEKFYDDMMNANDISTPQHKTQLKLLCKLEVEQNKALEEGHTKDFKDLNTQYNKLLENSGFRPIDRQDAGESVGIRTFSQIWEEVERDGFIKPVEIEESQDIIDKTIQYMSDYVHKLMNLNSLSSAPPDTPKMNEDEVNGE
jgi:hypothetical protein